MATTDFSSEISELAAGQPRLVSRKEAAELISSRLFIVSHRTIETWRLPVRRVNGRSMLAVEDVLAEALRRVSAAPPITPAGRTARTV